MQTVRDLWEACPVVVSTILTATVELVAFGEPRCVLAWALFAGSVGAVFLGGMERYAR